MSLLEDSKMTQHVIELGVGEVIQALIDAGEWSGPADDLGPKELLLYVVQLIEAREITIDKLLGWMPVVISSYDTEGLDSTVQSEDDSGHIVNSNITGDILLGHPNATTVIGYDNSAYITRVEDTSGCLDLYAAIGRLLTNPEDVNAILDGLEDKGITVFDQVEDLGYVNQLLTDLVIEGRIDLLDIFDYLRPVKPAEVTPADRHVELLSQVYQPLDRDRPIHIDDYVIDSIVSQYVTFIKSSAVVKQTGLSHRYEVIFEHDGTRQNINITRLLELAHALHNRGMYTVTTTSPFEGMDGNRIFISLTDNYEIIDTPIVIAVQ